MWSCPTIIIMTMATIMVILMGIISITTIGAAIATIAADFQA